MHYKQFLNQKKLQITNSGFDINKNELSPLLFEHQKDIVKWSLKKGKSAIWSGTGTGKTNMELEFARQVYFKTGKDVLIVAPLAVAHQTMWDFLAM